MLFSYSIKILFVTLVLITAPLHAANISKQQAAQIAQQQHSGRVLSVKVQGNSYKVKIISSSGQVRIIRVNATSGTVE